MSFQFSTTVRNAFNDQVSTTIGASAKLLLYTGTVPATCATAASGTLLATLSLPSTWIGASSAGVKSLSGTWTGTGSAAGTAGYFRIMDSGNTTCHIQGTVTASGGGGDMTIDNTSIANGQTINVNTFTLTAGGA